MTSERRAIKTERGPPKQASLMLGFYGAKSNTGERWAFRERHFWFRRSRRGRHGTRLLHARCR
jgi:hypothetical protein